MKCISFLNNKKYQVYNRDVAKSVGSIHAAIFLSELINRYEHHKEKEEEDGKQRFITHENKEWFYYTHKKGVERLVMSRKEQDAAIKILIKHGLIEKIQKGVPAKRYFTFNVEKILDLFGLSKKHSRMSQTDKLDCPKGTNCTVQKGQTGNYNIHTVKNPIKNPNKEEYPLPPLDDPHDVVDAPNGACVSPSSLLKVKQKFGPDGLVLLALEQFKKLEDEWGNVRLCELIEELNDYIASSGKKYKSHYHTLRQWQKRKQSESKRHLRKGKLAIEADKKPNTWKPDIEIV